MATKQRYQPIEGPQDALIAPLYGRDVPHPDPVQDPKKEVLGDEPPADDP
jgi:hypothetical protein